MEVFFIFLFLIFLLFFHLEGIVIDFSLIFKAMQEDCLLIFQHLFLIFGICFVNIERHLRKFTKDLHLFLSIA
jgi:hypothetical protein